MPADALLHEGLAAAIRDAASNFVLRTDRRARDWGWTTTPPVLSSRLTPRGLACVLMGGSDEVRLDDDDASLIEHALPYAIWRNRPGSASGRRASSVRRRPRRRRSERPSRRERSPRRDGCRAESSSCRRIWDLFATLRGVECFLTLPLGEESSFGCGPHMFLHKGKLAVIDSPDEFPCLRDNCLVHLFCCPCMIAVENEARQSLVVRSEKSMSGAIGKAI
jgi:hypothetical protein